jgi:tRNA A-37 threonylcarbamoyl transferase component Bud32
MSSLSRGRLPETLNETPPNTPPGECTLTELVTVLRVEQKDRWQRGDKILVEAYFQQYPQLQADQEAALDLIYSEFVLREQLGDQPQVTEYVQRFPHYGPSLRALLALDAVLSPTRSDSEGAEAQTSDKSVAPVAAPRGLRTIGKYLVIAPLGAGGQGHVYRAVHPELGREVVIKLSRQKFTGDSLDQDRLRAEGCILADLDHPNLARVYDLGVHEGHTFLVMEYVRGRTLDQVVNQEGRFPPRRAASLVAQAARALAVGHRRGILHRDLKPGNVVVEENGRPRIIDFGLARYQAWHTDSEEAGPLSGTAQFMAPEQARGCTDAVGPRCDIFALGSILYFVLTGRAPYRGKDLAEVLEQVRSCAFDCAALADACPSRRLTAICLRAMSAEPADRPASADELAEELEAYLRRPRVLLRRAVLAGAGLLALMAVGGWWWTTRHEEAVGSSVATPAPTASGTTPVDLQTGPPRLTVRVWDRDGYRNLSMVVPLRSNDRLQVRVEAPADLHVSLFLFSSEGALRFLAQRPPGPQALAYPEQALEAVPLTGAVGTEVLLTCGRRNMPVLLEDIRNSWEGEGAWPSLPGLSVLRLQGRSVTIEQKDRDLGAPRSQPDPEGEVRRRLESLGNRLSEHFEYCEGLAFAHQP